MNERELPPWLIGGAIAFFVLVVFGLWYHYLGPGSAQTFGWWAVWAQMRMPMRRSPVFAPQESG